MYRPSIQDPSQPNVGKKDPTGPSPYEPSTKLRTRNQRNQQGSTITRTFPLEARTKIKMSWCDFLTADGFVFPPFTSTAVRGRAALISEEEWILMDLLAPTETHFQVKPWSPANATEEENSACSTATTPCKSRRPSANSEPALCPEWRQMPQIGSMAAEMAVAAGQYSQK
ncbi:hypothetical protein T484DRAFT_1743258 [Baffinella frigidus]|nr:hypothetical protein T484DRAFT_1743258 [Cryptophyta sp. CCMP2293]